MTDILGDIAGSEAIDVCVSSSTSLPSVASPRECRQCITFCGGDSVYFDAGKRLIAQADQTELFDKTVMYTPEFIQSRSDFWEKHSDFVLRNKRGYGYWIWKPYIIQQTMNEMKDGDILLYLDCGCEIDVYKKDEIAKYFEYVKEDYIIGAITMTEKNWNKKDLIIRLGLENSSHLETEQYQAGALLFYVCDKTRKLVNDWYNIACYYNFIDDSPSFSPNYAGFIEHRHDQSIFSLLAKKYNLYSKKRLCSVIEYIRNRTGVSVLHRK